MASYAHSRRPKKLVFIISAGLFMYFQHSEIAALLRFDRRAEFRRMGNAEQDWLNAAMRRARKISHAIVTEQSPQCLEYRHAEFGEPSFDHPDTTGTYVEKPRFDTVRAGISYKF